MLSALSMKHILTLFVALLVLFTIGTSQCDGFGSLLPVKLGITKFATITTLNANKSVRDDGSIKKYGPGLYTYWDKPKYLSGDSVYRTQLNYEYITHGCLHGNENRLIMLFVDDRLYKAHIELRFIASRFDACMENYRELVKTLEQQPHSYSSEFIGSDSKTNEQIGEGHTFYTTKPVPDKPYKVNEIQIGYEIEYKTVWDSYQKKFVNGEISGYLIEIQFINLQGTKLTNEGY